LIGVGGDAFHSGEKLIHKKTGGEWEFSPPRAENSPAP
jgi:hypothetical protein